MASSVQNSGLVESLRARTAAHHAQLDAALHFRPGEVTRARYAAFLRGTLSVLQALEPGLTRWLGAGSWSRRLECLRLDLAALGAAAVDPAPLAPPATLTAAYGCAYVVEGSALGGMVLAPIFERELALEPGAATSYLRLWGHETAAHWRAFLARLSEFGASTSASDHEAACATACDTFDSYARALHAQGAM